VQATALHGINKVNLTCHSAQAKRNAESRDCIFKRVAIHYPPGFHKGKIPHKFSAKILRNDKVGFVLRNDKVGFVLRNDKVGFVLWNDKVGFVLWNDKVGFVLRNDKVGFVLRCDN